MKTEYGRMVVGRADTGEVIAAGWDCAETRKDAKEWIERGLTIELVTSDQVEAIEDEIGIFATTAPLGDVLSRQQALNAFSGYQ